MTRDSEDGPDHPSEEPSTSSHSLKFSYEGVIELADDYLEQKLVTDKSDFIGF